METRAANHPSRELWRQEQPAIQAESYGDKSSQPSKQRVMETRVASHPSRELWRQEQPAIQAESYGDKSSQPSKQRVMETRAASHPSRELWRQEQRVANLFIYRESFHHINFEEAMKLSAFCKNTKYKIKLH